MVETIKDKLKIAEECHGVSIGDKLLVNDRSNYLTVKGKYEHYKDAAVDFFFELYGNGYGYLFVVFEHSHPSLFIQSDYRIEDVEYTDGYKFVTEGNSGERVRELFVSGDDYCHACECEKLYDSTEDGYYCPMCLEF